MLLKPEFIIYLWLFPATLFFVLPLLFFVTQWTCRQLSQKHGQQVEKESGKLEFADDQAQKMAAIG